MMTGILGLVCGLTLSGVFPNFLVYPDSAWDGFPRWIALAMKIEVGANNWPWVLVTSLVVIAAIVEMKFSRYASLFAAGLGILIGSLVMRALRVALLR